MAMTRPRERRPSIPSTNVRQLPGAQPVPEVAAAAFHVAMRSAGLSVGRVLSRDQPQPSPEGVPAGTSGRSFGTAWIALSFTCLFLVCSRFGRIRLGDEGSSPEFSTFSWIAMLFSAAVGLYATIDRISDADWLAWANVRHGHPPAGDVLHYVFGTPAPWSSRPS
ncbi:BCCT family transporter [Candidatus Palauibacter sp.]|uniref:BCCT family transporter n=1 Tax=Candidatus Palauibacter sp. TaxID=3101350 RepID=UPI003B020656